MPDENQKQYEITLILSPELKEEEISSFQEEVKKNIEKLEGSLRKIEKPEKRNLSYPIKKFRSGYYLIVNFLFNPEKLDELYSVLKHKKEIIRYIIILTPEEKSRIAPVKKMKPKIEKPVSPIPADKYAASEPKEKVKETTKKKKEIQLEDIDKKLDEILGT